MTKRAASSRGYSLPEMLVVIAIIGIISLVTVPQFMTYSRQGKLRTAVRQFNSDLRVARQRAISQTRRTAVSFTAGASPAAPLVRGRYALFEQQPDASWSRFGPWKELPEGIYFTESDFAQDSAIDDDLHDVVFRGNGTVDNLPGGAGETPTVELVSPHKFPKNHCTVTMHVGGTISSAFNTD